TMMPEPTERPQPTEPPEPTMMPEPTEPPQPTEPPEPTERPQPPEPTHMPEPPGIHQNDNMAGRETGYDVTSYLESHVLHRGRSMRDQPYLAIASVNQSRSLLQWARPAGSNLFAKALLDGRGSRARSATSIQSHRGEEDGSLHAQTILRARPALSPDNWNRNIPWIGQL
ncbi:MAG: hypothetical protein GXP41_05260, partial [Chloroflexi bacterium]|nr:hypothetical protein [Chloroflexota bacterium]